jgi:hypothetical protein
MRRICWSFSAELGARFAALVAGLSMLSGCDNSASPDTRLLTLGSICYRVPVSELVYFSKSGRAAAMQFANARVRDSVPDYSIPPAMSTGVQDALYVGVFTPTDAEAARIRADDVKLLEESSRLWYALHEFSKRIVEPIDGTTLYRVRPLAGGPTWFVVTQPPDPEQRDTHLAGGFRVASCAEIDEGRLNRCTAHVERDGVLMTMYTTEANLPQRESLARFVIESMDRWKTACGSSGQAHG